MSGTSLPYHLRQNKHVERHLFVDLLDHVDRWRPLKGYLYVGFGGIYFEDFKLLHSHFAINKMLSIENQHWVLPRQKANLPYGCIDAEHCDSADFIRDLSKFREKYQAENLLCWLDYASSADLASQLNDVKAMLPGLLANDILKVTLAANPSVLASRTSAGDTELLEKRLEELRSRLLGTQFLADGVTADQMTEQRYPGVLSEAFQRVVAEAMRESPSLVFQPIGSYIYKDVTQMVTFAGIVLEGEEAGNFLERAGLQNFELAGLSWQLQRIEVPDLSLREKLLLDQIIFNRTAEEVEAEIKFKLDSDSDYSLSMIESYMKFYRYYPSFHRVLV